MADNIEYVRTPIKYTETMEGRKINTGNINLFFLRHSDIIEDSTDEIVDVPLSLQGINKAKKLDGHFDLVICSPLRRAKETLHYSGITFDRLIINENIREYVQGTQSLLCFEKMKQEDINTFWKRGNLFTEQLENYCNDLKNKQGNVLVISHEFFFNGWYRNGNFIPPKNAEFVKLVNIS